MTHIRKWNRFMAVSCSHGDMLDENAARAVLKFKETWKPKETIHLGDYLDATALRSGAAGTTDETVDIDNDVIAGVRFLKKYQPTVLINGNHDIRAWELTHHHNAIISKCAKEMVDEIRRTVKQLKCKFYEEYSIESSVFQLGDTKFVHGFMYNEQAIRDHAEHFGKVVFGHLHKVGMASGRRYDNPTGYCVGLLGNIKKMKYANRRRATSQWQNGFAFGEYSDDQCVVFLNSPSREGMEWRLPV